MAPGEAQPPPEAPPPPLPITTTMPPPAAPPPPETAETRSLQPSPPVPLHVLIALKDGWVYAATDYWVDGATLHYLTLEGDHDQVSLELVDRKISARLSQAAGMKFVLP
jgi:hypothetical protein